MSMITARMFSRMFVLVLTCSIGHSVATQMLFYNVACNPTSAQSFVQLGINIRSLMHCSHLCLRASWCGAFKFQSGICSGMSLSNVTNLRTATNSNNVLQVYVPSQAWPVPRATPKFLVQHNSKIGIVNLPCTSNCVSSNCSTPPSHPLSATGVTAATINGRLTMCGGGVNDVYFNISNCYALDTTTNTWTKFPSMNVQRYAAAATLVDSGWWVTGGYNSISTWLSSTEILNLTTLTWTTGPILPSARGIHCVVTFNSTHTFLGGGYQRVDAYLYRWTTGQWLSLPKLNSGGYTSCAARYDQNGKAWGVIVVGNTNLVQFIDLIQNTTSLFPNMSLSTVPSSTFIKDGAMLYLVNPMSNSYLLFNDTTLTFGVVAGSNTKGISNTYVAVVAVNDDYFSC